MGRDLRGKVDGCRTGLPAVAGENLGAWQMSTAFSRGCHFLCLMGDKAVQWAWGWDTDQRVLGVSL